MDEEEQPNAEGFIQPQVYDFLKHISTLSLISIGGILGLVRDEMVQVPMPVVVIALGSIALAALLSVMTNSTIAGASAGDKMPSARYLSFVRGLVAASYLFGVGIFIGAFGSGVFGAA